MMYEEMKELAEYYKSCRHYRKTVNDCNNVELCVACLKRKNELLKKLVDEQMDKRLSKSKVDAFREDCLICRRRGKLSKRFWCEVCEALSKDCAPER